MGSSGSLAILCLSIIGYIVGIAGLVAGVLGPAWFVRMKQDATLGSSEGLLKTCTESAINGEQMNCIDRKDVLKFRKEDNEFSNGTHYCFLTILVVYIER